MMGILNRLEELGVDKQKWAQEAIHRGLTRFSNVTAESRGTFCVGDELTWADIFLVPQMYHGHGFGIDIAKEFPDLFAHYSKLEKHPAFQAAHAINNNMMK